MVRHLRTMSSIGTGRARRLCSAVGSAIADHVVDRLRLRHGALEPCGRKAPDLNAATNEPRDLGGRYGPLPTFRRGARPCAPTCRGEVPGGVASWPVATGAPARSGAFIQMIPRRWLGITNKASTSISARIAGDPRKRHGAPCPYGARNVVRNSGPYGVLGGHAFGTVRARRSCYCS